MQQNLLAMVNGQKYRKCTKTTETNMIKRAQTGPFLLRLIILVKIYSSKLLIYNAFLCHF